jgi:hypothetical protein
MELQPKGEREHNGTVLLYFRMIFFSVCIQSKNKNVDKSICLRFFLRSFSRFCFCQKSRSEILAIIEFLILVGLL